MKIQKGKSDSMANEEQIACESLKMDEQNEMDEDSDNNNGELSWKERRAQKNERDQPWKTLQI